MSDTERFNDLMRAKQESTMTSQKPQKRLQIMQGGRLRPFSKGQILTFSESAGVYYFEHKGKLRQSPFTPEQLDNMHDSLVQPLSADGLTRDKLWHNFNNGSALEVYLKNVWESAERPGLHNIDFYRLKPQPKFIDVPDCVKLWNNSILNSKRFLQIERTDGLPVLGILQGLDPSKPHKIDLTPLEEFEDGQVYFWALPNSSQDKIKAQYEFLCNYFVFCKKENRMYGFREHDNYSMRGIDAKGLETYLKVIPA